MAHSALVVAYRNAAPALRVFVFAHSSEFLGASGGFSQKLNLKPIAGLVAAHAPNPAAQALACRYGSVR